MSSRRKRRGAKLLIALALALICVAPFALSRKLIVREYEMRSPKLRAPHHFAVVSDLHNSFYGPRQRELAQAILDSGADALLLLGDMADSYAELGGALALLEELNGALPVYSVSGNHECAYKSERLRIEDALRNAGAHLLKGECARLGEIRVAGVDDPLACTRAEWRAQIEDVRGDPEEFTLLLCHRPERVAESAQGFDLALSGHTHGGQIRIPGLLNGLWAPNQGWFPRYAGGRYALDAGELIVSRGLEKSWIPRVFNRPELVIVQLSPERAA